MSDVVTLDKAREQAAAAERLMHDPYLRETFDRLVEAHTQTAIRSPDAATREASRQQVLAILSLQGLLKSDFEHWQSAGQRLAHQREHE